jgi:hypothetical protein
LRRSPSRKQAVEFRTDNLSDLANPLYFRGPLSNHRPLHRLCIERGDFAAPLRGARAMQYLLLIYSDEKAMQAAPPDQNGAILAAYGAYMKAMADAGVSKGGQRLHPTAMAATVRVENGKARVLNGPYAETKEQLGGYFLIDAPDLDAAISWAARCPGAQYGAIEVRPIWEMAAAPDSELRYERKTAELT